MNADAGLPLTSAVLLKQQVWARQDDWDKYFVGSDIRVLIGQALAALSLKAENRTLANAAITATERAEKAEAEASRLRGELEAARKDAKRYRLIRDMSPILQQIGRQNLITGNFGNELDAAIDAALSRKPGAE